MNNVNIITNNDINIIDDKMEVSKMVSMLMINCFKPSWEICQYVYFVDNNQITIKTYIDDKSNIDLFEYINEKHACKKSFIGELYGRK